MLINDLPDDCLVAILDFINVIDDFIALSKVFPDWTDLIDPRLSKVKYLLMSKKSNDISRTINLRDPLILKNHKLNQLLPNLKIIDASYEITGLSYEDIKEIIPVNPTVRGLIDPPCFIEPSTPTCRFESIEMLKTNWIDFGYFEEINSSITQLYIESCYLKQLGGIYQCFPNLIRLHVGYNQHSQQQYSPKYFPGSILKNLKILEFQFEPMSAAWVYPGPYLIDFCEQLESAFFYIETWSLSADVTKIHYSVKDLVIEYKEGYSDYWSFWQPLLTKYPNLEHLAIRGNNEIVDEDIEEMVTLLPKIKLIDFRGSSNITRKSADYVERFCSESGRSILIYFNCDDEPSHWHKLGHSDDQVCFGLDFMKNCFFKHWNQLPYLLDTS